MASTLKSRFPRKADWGLFAVTILYCAGAWYGIVTSARAATFPSRDLVGFLIGSGPVLAFSLIVVACDFKCFSLIAVLICLVAFLAMGGFAAMTFQAAAAAV